MWRSLFVLLSWPLSMRPRQHDRFVLIGLCWLYGRTEFPPPPYKATNTNLGLTAKTEQVLGKIGNYLALGVQGPVQGQKFIAFVPGQGGGGENSLRPYRQQRPMRTNLS